MKDKRKHPSAPPRVEPTILVVVEVAVGLRRWWELRRMYGSSLDLVIGDSHVTKRFRSLPAAQRAAAKENERVERWVTSVDRGLQPRVAGKARAESTKPDHPRKRGARQQDTHRQTRRQQLIADLRAVGAEVYVCPDPSCGGFAYTRRADRLMGSGTDAITPEAWHRRNWRRS